MKKLLMIVMLLLTLSVSVHAVEDCIGPCDGGSRNTSVLDVQECTVEVNGRMVKNDQIVLKAFERGEDLEVEIEFVSNQDAEDVQIMAFITGDDRSHNRQDMVVDMTPTFDVEQNVAYRKDLNLAIPYDFDLDTGDELKLRVVISDKFSSTYIREYNLKVEALRHDVLIQDILLDPATSVQSGRGMFGAVRIRNLGERDEESLKVTLSIPALGLKATEYIDELEADEATTSEDVFLRIPSCTEEGSYVIKATVEYADGDETVTKETRITVTEDDSCDGGSDSGSGSSGTDRTVVTVPGRQDIVKGTQGSVFPIILENRGASTRAYEIKVSGVDSWATYRVDPAAYLVVSGNDMETVYLYLTPKDDAVEGEKVFMVSVETDGDKKQIALTANVVAGDTGSESPIDLGGLNLRNGLEIALIVLIVILVVLALVVGFSKLKDDGKNGGDDMSGQTYY